MTGKLMKFGVLAAVLALVVTAFAAQSPEKMSYLEQQKQRQEPLAPRPGYTVEDVHACPVAAEHRVPGEVRASSRSVSVLDDTRRPRRVSMRASTSLAPNIELITICDPGTTYDYQHNDLGEHQIATIGGDESITNVHFAWMHWDFIPESLDQVDRFVNYQGYNPNTGMCLQDCGVTVSGAGGDPLLARAGYVTCDVSTIDNAFLTFHQRDETMQPASSPQTYSTWALTQGIPCFHLWVEDQLNQSVVAEAIWPHGRIDKGGSIEKAPGDDVYHVVSHPWGQDVPYYTEEIIYWRRIGDPPGGVWQGPVCLDMSFGAINHDLAVDPTTPNVAVIYERDDYPMDVNGLLQVGYMVSPDNGADWILAEATVAPFPTPLTTVGFQYCWVTTYTNGDSAQAWLEAGGEYDREGGLHVYWIEQVFANESADCRLKHWYDADGGLDCNGVGILRTVAQAIGWDNQGGDGNRDLWLAFPNMGFGDGQTECSDGPDNLMHGNPHSNYNYAYMTYEQYGGPTLVEQADISAPNEQQNLEIYIATSNDVGVTWSPPVNLTNSKTPGCDGTAGNKCKSERDPSIAYEVNDAIHILYIEDTHAGDAVFASSDWTYNPVIYMKIHGGTDAEVVCPEIAPSCAVELTDSDPDCEYNASPDAKGIVVENLIVSNLGNAPMTGVISVEDGTCPCDGSAPPTWLTVVPSGPYVIQGGSSQTSVVTMTGTGLAEGLYQAKICVTHDADNIASPVCIPVNFFVFREFYCPEYEVLKTGTDPTTAPFYAGVLYLEVSNVERFGNQTEEEGGLSRINPNPAIGDSSWCVYDGSLVMGVPPDPDTLVFRNIFGEGNNSAGCMGAQPGFRALGNLVIDTSTYGTNAGGATAFANQTTTDSSVAIDVTYEFPQSTLPNESEFVLLKYKFRNDYDDDILDAIIGVAIDFDVMPAAYMSDLQTDAENTGHLQPNWNLLYQQGCDSTDHVPVGDTTATRFQNGVSALMCTPAPRGWIAPNDPWLFERPGGGFHEGYLYDEMTKSGFELFPTDEPCVDLHSVIVADQDMDLNQGDVRYYCFALVSSNRGAGGDPSDLLLTTQAAWRYAFGWWVFTYLDSVPHLTPMSYPYYALGTHESGLGGGCCGCIVSEVEDEDDLFDIVPGPDPCEGTIEFAGGSDNGCDYPYQATFKVEDLCMDQSELATIVIESAEGCDCDCPFQSDFDEDGFYTALDLGAMIDILFAGATDVQDAGCPTTRADFDCDGFSTALDLGGIIDLLFAGGPEPCEPCDVF